MKHEGNAKTNNMNALQKKTFLRFKERLEEMLPSFRIAWALGVEKDFIELHLETDKRTYRNSLMASKLATEVEDETGVTIILR